MTNKLFHLVLFIVLSATHVRCGMSQDFPSEETTTQESSDGAAQSSERRKSQPVRLRIDVIRTNATSTDDIVDLRYENADFASVLRCNSKFILRKANGLPVRSSVGKLQPMTALDAKAAWTNAFSEITQCQLIGEKLMRASFADSFSESGTYYYLFRPCVAEGEDKTSQVCAEHFVSSPDIVLHNVLTLERREQFRTLLMKEAQLAGVAIRFREQLEIALEEQQRCEQNKAVDAVKEAKAKALVSVLSTSLAAAVGGAIAGPVAALTAARQTLSWITEYLGAGTQSNPNQCSALKNSEDLATAAAREIDSLQKEISQLQTELADLKK